MKVAIRKGVGPKGMRAGGWWRRLGGERRGARGKNRRGPQLIVFWPKNREKKQPSN
jgi:hypothetical protein